MTDQEERTCSFRYSRYDPSLRLPDGTWPEGTWTEVFELVKSLEDRGAALAVYEPVEDAYVEAALVLLRLYGADRVRLGNIERSPLISRRMVELGVDVPLPDPLPDEVDLASVPAIIRACLRGKLWCEIQGPGIDISFGFELYMFVRCRPPCEQAKAAVEDLGLFVQDADYPVEED